MAEKSSQVDLLKGEVHPNFIKIGKKIADTDEIRTKGVV